MARFVGNAAYVDPVVAAYDFAPFRTIIDVGGGLGRLLARTGCASRADPSSTGYPRAARTGATLLLVEFVIPQHDREFIGKWADMEMLVQAGFQMTRVVPTVGPISLVEGKAV